MCMQYLYHIHTPITFHWYQHPQTGPVSTSCSQTLQKKKKRHFCLFNIATQGVSLWHFHIYMYYNLNWFIPSIFLLSTLVLFLWWLQQV
jgi:hypothetical protein